MADADCMEVLNACNQLVEKLGCFLFPDPLTVYNEFEELPSTGILHYQVNFVRCLQYFIQLNYHSVPHYPENVYFPSDSLHVVDVDNLGFLEHFDCNFLAGGKVCSNFDLAEGALAKVFAHFVVAHQGGTVLNAK
jgi:hypothetical protein